MITKSTSEQAVPISAAQRKAAERERKAALGLKQINLWAHPEDHQALKTLSAELKAHRTTHLR